MSTITKPNPVELMLVKYSIADKQIAELREEYKGLSVATKEGYESVRLAIATTRKCRVEIDKQRKLFKEDALSWGRKVDAEAKRLTGLLEAIETPLQAAKDEADAAVERIRKAKADAARKVIEDAAFARLMAEADERRKQREAEEAKLRAEREELAAERKKIQAEQKAVWDAQEKERSRLAEEDRIRNAERLKERERLAEEQAKLDAERLAIETEKQRLRLAEFQRLAKIKAEREAVEYDRQERIDKESREKAEAEAAEAERLRVEAMRPDVEKVHAFGVALLSIAMPEVTSQRASAFVAQMKCSLTELWECCEAFEA